MKDCIFDKILAKEIPANVVYEDEHVLAFHDINPQAPIHVLVIPKKKIVSFVDVAGQDAHTMGHYFQAISKTASKLGLDEDGYRVCFNTGSHGQQTVPYIHAHILGGRQMRWPPG